MNVPAQGWVERPANREAQGAVTARTPLHPIIRVDCGWCGTTITPGPPAPVSHGICKRCRALYFKDVAA